MLTVPVEAFMLNIVAAGCVVYKKKSKDCLTLQKIELFQLLLSRNIWYFCKSY